MSDLSADAETLPGITDPFPDIFDPANLLARADGGIRPVAEVKRWREAEITHGKHFVSVCLTDCLSWRWCLHFG